MPTADSFDRKILAAAAAKRAAAQKAADKNAAARRAAAQRAAAEKAAIKKANAAEKARNDEALRQAAEIDAEDAAAARQAAQVPENTEAYKSQLQGDYLGWQKTRADEIQRLRNLETQLFGQGGTVEQQNTQSAQDRRRLAAQMASSGTLQGGAYAGPERGLDTQMRVSQTGALQETLRPYVEQTQTNRLGELGITYDPRTQGTSQVAQSSYGGTFAQEGPTFDWTKSTWAGQQASAQARAAALQQLLSGMTTV